MLMFSSAVVLVWRVSEHPEVRPVEVIEAGHGGRVQGREVAGRQLIRAAAAARVPGRGCNIQRQGHAFMEGNTDFTRASPMLPNLAPVM